jgi:hypothetical protein
MDLDIYEEIRKAGPKLSQETFSIDDIDSICIEEIRREIFIDRFSWAVPDKKSVQEITNFINTDKCLEIGAGKGLWAYLLKLEGINITVVDNLNDNETKLRKEIEENIRELKLPKELLDYKPRKYFDVEILDGFNALDKYKDHNVLFLCWSRKDFTCEFKGNKIIYIGESDNKFIPGVPNKKEWKRVKIINNPLWIGLHDRIELYERRK